MYFFSILRLIVFWIWYYRSLYISFNSIITSFLSCYNSVPLLSNDDISPSIFFILSYMYFFILCIIIKFKIPLNEQRIKNMDEKMKKIDGVISSLNNKGVDEGRNVLKYIMKYIIIYFIIYFNTFLPFISFLSAIIYSFVIAYLSFF